MTSMLSINRSKPFDPVSFFQGRGSILEQDERSLALIQVDFSIVRFHNGLRGDESQISGVEKLSRLKQSGLILLDANIGQALLEEEGQRILRNIYDRVRTSWLELAGTLLQDENDKACLLNLVRNVDGTWLRCSQLLDLQRAGNAVCPLLSPQHA